MTADRTQHVLDAIDGALEDWTVSTDAMRWSPEPVEPGVWRVDYSHWSLPEPLQPQPVDWSAVEYIEGRAPQAMGVLTNVRLAPPGTPMPNFAEQIAAATAELLRAFGRIGAAIQPFASQIAVAHAAEMERRTQRAPATFAGLRPVAVIIDEPFDDDPRARALELRRTRNTGPERKPAGRQKRPRDL